MFMTLYEINYGGRKTPLISSSAGFVSEFTNQQIIFFFLSGTFNFEVNLIIFNDLSIIFTFSLEPMYVLNIYFLRTIIETGNNQFGINDTH